MVGQQHEELSRRVFLKLGLASTLSAAMLFLSGCLGGEQEEDDDDGGDDD